MDFSKDSILSALKTTRSFIKRMLSKGDVAGILFMILCVPLALIACISILYLVIIVVLVDLVGSGISFITKSIPD